MRRKARVDANHAVIVEALRKAGWFVLDTSRVGGGFPDALIARGGRVEFVEIKDGDKIPSKRQLTTAEAKFHRSLLAEGVTVRVIETIEQAVQL